MGAFTNGHIWDGHHHEMCTKPKLTANDVKRWEKKYRLRLPASLVAALKVQNGGSLKPQRFRFGQKIWEIDEIPGIAVDAEVCCLAPLGKYLREECEGIYRDKHGDPDKLVILSGDGHSYCCLDYNETPPDRPAVSYVEIECGPGKERICESFDELLAHAYAGDPKPAFQFGELPTGFETVASLETSSRARGRGEQVRKTRALVAISAGELIADQEGPTWLDDLCLERVRCRLKSVSIGAVTENDRNGKRIPPVFELVLEASDVSQGLTSEREEGLWINKDWAHPIQITLADNDQSKLKKVRAQLLALQKK